MKLTKSKLKQLIKEEMTNFLSENAGRPGEETVDEAGPYGTSASRSAGSSWEGRTSPNPAGKFYIGRPFTGKEYNTFAEAEADAEPFDRIYDSEGNWKVKI